MARRLEEPVRWDYMSSLPKGFQEPLNYALVDVEWVRRLDLTCDNHGTPPGEGTGSDQIYDKTEAESRRHAVAFAEPSERTVVRDARPALLATRDQAEAIIEGHAGLDLRSPYQLLCLDLDDLNPELCTLRQRHALYLIKHGEPKRPLSLYAAPRVQGS